MTDTADANANHSDPQKQAFDAGKTAAENRWLLLIVGIVTLIAGAVALAMPFLASQTATLLIGWVLIVSGAVGLVTAFRRHAGWSMAAAFALSIVSILGGVLMLTQPMTGLLALTTILIAYFAASSVVRLFYGIRFIRDGGIWMAAGGLLSLLLAILLFFGLPFSAAWVPGVMLAVDLIILGALEVALGIGAGRKAQGSSGKIGASHA